MIEALQKNTLIAVHEPGVFRFRTCFSRTDRKIPAELDGLSAALEKTDFESIFPHRKHFQPEKRICS